MQQWRQLQTQPPLAEPMSGYPGCDLPIAAPANTGVAKSEPFMPQSPRDGTDKGKMVTSSNATECVDKQTTQVIGESSSAPQSGHYIQGIGSLN
jgi:hypothetical protein